MKTSSNIHAHTHTLFGIKQTKHRSTPVLGHYVKQFSTDIHTILGIVSTFLQETENIVTMAHVLNSLLHHTSFYKTCKFRNKNWLIMYNAGVLNLSVISAANDVKDFCRLPFSNFDKI